MQTSYDLIIIGGGPGGYVAAIRAAQLGMRVAVVEKEALGGVCLNWGCIPTKALLKSAQVFEYIKHADAYGIKVQDATPDFASMVKRSREVAGTMSKGIGFLFKKHQIDTIYGTGRLGSRSTVIVEEAPGKSTTYQARHIILATGSRARELPQLPIDHKNIIGYREALSLPQQPKSMVIVGAGAIGVEFAYFYQTIGTEVTLIEYMPRILPVEDEDISKQLLQSFTKAGIKVLTGTEVIGVATTGNQIQVNVKTQTGTQQIPCEVVLSAAGVVSNLEHLGLEEVGVTVEKGKVVVDDFYHTSVPGIYAIGDIVKGPALAHVASAEGIVCVEKIGGLEPEPLDYHNLPSCTYCQPEVASVGYTEQAAREAGYQIKVGKFPFSASGKAQAAGYPTGFIKVIFDAKYGEWLGAHMIGANVTELIAEVVTARKLETTGHEIIKSVHPHPTMSEAIMEAVAAAYQEAIHI
jgi:dihydrolipoamide dehydrogenase